MGTENTQKQSEENSSKKSEPLVRYSDQDLKEFREMITAKLEESRKSYELMRETLSLKGDPGTEDTSPTFKLVEDAGDMLNKEELSQYAIRQLKYINSLENALIRIENKTYGICRITGKLISKERLRSVPHSTMSIDAKMGIKNA
jgi:DnaK suppressor protein